MNASNRSILISVLIVLLVWSGSYQCARGANPDTTKPAGGIEVELIGNSGTDNESAEVLNALRALLSGLASRDLNRVGDCLRSDVIMFDDAKHKVLFGKDDVLAHVKANVIGTQNVSPVRRIAVHDPFVRVKGNVAMVSFRATKQLHDSSQLESWCSEIFEKQDGKWLILQLRTNWNPLRSENKPAQK